MLILINSLSLLSLILNFSLYRFDCEDMSLKDGRKRKSCRESLVLKDSNNDLSLQLQDDKYHKRSVSVSCSSSLSSEVLSEEIRGCRMRLISAMARHHQMNLKVILFLCFWFSVFVLVLVQYCLIGLHSM